MFSGFMSSMKGFLGWENLEVEQAGEPTVTDQAEIEERKSLFKQLYNFIGKDITSMISLPVWVFEPLSFLQIMTEPMLYGDLLFKAADCDDPSLRLAYVTAFILGGYKCATRIKKPFNPLLGETFEFVSKDKSWRAFAEQVSHHPPIGVCEVSSEKFMVHLEMQLTSKLRGNSSDVQVFGTNYIRFPKYGDVITWSHLETCAHNIIIGGMWVDHFGEIQIKNITTGDYCDLHVTKTGWLGAGRHETRAEVYNPKGEMTLKLNGKWNEYLQAIRVGKGVAEGDSISIWKTGNEGPLNNWLWPRFTLELTEVTPELKAILPPTDSRFRSDRKALQDGNLDLAGKEKHRLEEEQRGRKKAREAKGEVYTPAYFRKGEHKDLGAIWEYHGHYWEERDARLEKLKEQKDVPEEKLAQNLADMKLTKD